VGRPGRGTALVIEPANVHPQACNPFQGIIVGRPRDGNDRVAWLSERGRYAEALSVAEEDYSGALGWYKGASVQACVPVYRKWPLCPVQNQAFSSDPRLVSEALPGIQNPLFAPGSPLQATPVSCATTSPPPCLLRSTRPCSG